MFQSKLFSCCVEMPKCYWIKIKDCPEMKIFWYDGILYTPSLGDLFVENSYLPNIEDDVNEVILRQCKSSSE